ncbi:MAG: riboflavin synthase [Deltaproteobacteria bacterium]|nr:riboflavin synthase [Deltaproteobacteria bacterium]
MFTGIVEDLGAVKGIKRKSKEVVFTFKVGNINLNEVGLGDSIALNGTCLTVTALSKHTFSVDASHETLAKTNLGKLKVGKSVNLERALKVGDKLGGHIVNGHVDGVGEVVSKRKQGESVEIKFSVPKELSKYIVEKGSVAIDGVSLTVNSVRGNEFVVNIIPYTQEATTFGGLRKRGFVNIECDIIGKYVEKFVTGTKEKNSIYQFQK